MQVFYSPIIGNIELTSERKVHILASHPELKIHFEKLSQVLINPDEIRRSSLDKNVLLFYKFFDKVKDGKYINVTVKTGNRNFVLTSYITDKIRAGETYETEKKYS